MSSSASTLLDKLWQSHEIVKRDDEQSLLWVDRHWVHEGSHHAFAKLKAKGKSVAEPRLTFGVTDHYAPTGQRDAISDPSIIRMIDTLAVNTQANAIRHFDLHDPRQGIVHVIGPELGLTLPGLLINCGDSHTSTHGALGSLSFGIGATEVAHVLATQTLWQKKPKAMQLRFNGTLNTGVSAKDLALHWIAALGAGGAKGYAIEYSGLAVSAMTMDARMTLCNMSIEGGAKFGLIAPDNTTIDYLHGKPFAPRGDVWNQAVAEWQLLRSHENAKFEKSIEFDADKVAPTLTWGTSPDQAIGVDGRVPSADAALPEHRATLNTDLDYMGLKAGQSLLGLTIDQVFIGSCTNARLEDLRTAAAVLKGQKAKVPGLVSPGSTHIKKQAEAEGLDRIFKEAGLRWGESGCSSCVAMNGDRVPSGSRCASTTNRNFRGRQGPQSRTHLMSPAMVAAAAVHGRISDVREHSIQALNG